MKQRKIVVTFSRTQEFRFELDESNNFVQMDLKSIWANGNTGDDVAKKLLDSDEKRSMIKESFSDLNVNEFYKVDYRQFFDNLTEAIAEAIEDDPEELKMALKEEGYDYDLLVEEGLKFIEALRVNSSKCKNKRI